MLESASGSSAIPFHERHLVAVACIPPGWLPEQVLRQHLLLGVADRSLAVEDRRSLVEVVVLRILLAEGEGLRSRLEDLESLGTEQVAARLAVRSRNMACRTVGLGILRQEQSSVGLRTELVEPGRSIRHHRHHHC